MTSVARSALKAAIGSVAETVITLLKHTEYLEGGFAVNQLTHNLQTGWLAEQAGEDDEVVVAAVIHDIGKVISKPNHNNIVAEIAKPFVRPDVYNMLLAHQDFEGRFYYKYVNKNPDAYKKHIGTSYYELTKRFSDEYDQKAFDPNAYTPSLEHFIPKIEKVFAYPKYNYTPDLEYVKSDFS
jgi:predicted HD phosphohydrolase